MDDVIGSNAGWDCLEGKAGCREAEPSSRFETSNDNLSMIEQEQALKELCP